MEKNQNNSVSLIVDEFSLNLKKMMEIISKRVTKNSENITVEAIHAFSERYGVYTHNQCYLLISEMKTKLEYQRYPRICYIIEAILNDASFQKAGMYWDNARYRLRKEVIDHSSESPLSVTMAMEMRITDGENEIKLLSLCLGWLLWLQYAIPCVKKIGGTTGDQYDSYWNETEYFKSFLSSIKSHALMLEEAIIRDYAEEDQNECIAAQWKLHSENVLSSLQEYNNKIFFQII